jgi:hypothetical protein
MKRTWEIVWGNTRGTWTSQPPLFLPNYFVIVPQYVQRLLAPAPFFTHNSSLLHSSHTKSPCPICPTQFAPAPFGPHNSAQLDSPRTIRACNICPARLAPAPFAQHNSHLLCLPCTIRPISIRPDSLTRGSIHLWIFVAPPRKSPDISSRKCLKIS